MEFYENFNPFRLVAESLDFFFIALFDVIESLTKIPCGGFNPFRLVAELCEAWCRFLEELIKSLISCFFTCKIPDDLDETVVSPFCLPSIPPRYQPIICSFILLLLWSIFFVALWMTVKYCSLWICNRRAAKRYQNTVKKIIKIPQASSSYFHIAKMTFLLELESICCIIWSLTKWNAMKRENSLLAATASEACYLIFISHYKDTKHFKLLPQEVIVEICKYIHSL